jgi:thioredoxin-related protein
LFRINFRVDNIDKTAKDNDEIKNVPCIAKVVFESKSCKFENELKREDCRENHVQSVEHFGVKFWLSVKLHRKRDRVYHDQNEDCVLKGLRSYKPPNFVLDPMFRYIPRKT